jgi:hypothetical protein
MSRRLDAAYALVGAVILEKTPTSAPSGAEEAVREESTMKGESSRTAAVSPSANHGSREPFANREVL